MKRRYIIAGIVVLLPFAASWWAADELVHPPRRPLQDFHREFLANPSAHGVVLKSVTCLYAALPSGMEKRWLEIPGAGHNNVLITDFPIYAEMAEWLLRYVP